MELETATRNIQCRYAQPMARGPQSYHYFKAKKITLILKLETLLLNKTKHHFSNVAVANNFRENRFCITNIEIFEIFLKRNLFDFLKNSHILRT